MASLIFIYGRLSYSNYRLDYSQVNWFHIFQTCRLPCTRIAVSWLPYGKYQLKDEWLSTAACSHLSFQRCSRLKLYKRKHLKYLNSVYSLFKIFQQHKIRGRSGVDHISKYRLFFSSIQGWSQVTQPLDKDEGFRLEETSELRDYVTNALDALKRCECSGFWVSAPWLDSEYGWLQLGHQFIIYHMG